MDLIRCGEVSSTSTVASTLLREGRPAPFAVWARSQTAGRGRRDHGWSSPEGGLYMTVVMPSKVVAEAAEKGEMGWLPLKASVLLARLIEERTGFRITLKWPNDVLWQGRKLGGLLLETSSVGSRLGDLVIGIGLNLNGAPEFAGPYAATCLRDIEGRPQNVEEWALALAEAFSTHWDRLSTEQVAPAYGRYAVAMGSIWQHPTMGGLYQSLRLESDASLALRGTGQGADLADVVVSSVEQGYRWIYLGAASLPMAVLDIGNSRIKAALFTSDAAEKPLSQWDLAVGSTSRPLPEAELATRLLEWRHQFQRPLGWPLHLASVHPEALAQVVTVAKSVGWTPLELSKRPVRWREGTYELRALGIDRLAAMEGYLGELATAGLGSPQRYGLVVSAGTATTVDVVRGDGAHLGGIIMPGLALSLRSLHQAARLLPELQPQDLPRASLGLATEGAMRQGVLLMTLGAIERCQKLLHEADPEARRSDLVVTGGAGPYLVPHLPSSRLAPELILKGLRQMVLAGA